MIAHHEFNNLLHNLQKMYHKLGLYLYNIRKNAYHKPSQQKSYDIYDTIYGHINTLTKKAKTNLSKPRIPGLDAIHFQPKDYVESVHDNFVSTGIHTHLNHYKFKKSSSNCNPAIKEQLSKNTWEHIHKAIRYARQGKKTEAKLFGELANNALKEAAHYMSEDEYLIFTSAIDVELNRIKN